MWILGVVSGVLLFLFLYFRWKFKFWKDQPVFHVYDYWWYIVPPGIINTSLPPRNKYVNLYAIETIPIHRLTISETNQFIEFIKNNYRLKNQKVQSFTPQLNDIIPYFQGNTQDCFLTCYEKRGGWVSVMTSRPLVAHLHNEKMSIYYVDYLCVDRDMRNRGIAQEMIQTHEYNQRRENRQIYVSLFKREEKLTGIVPITAYTASVYDMIGWSKHVDMEKTNISNTLINVTKCSKGNMHVWIEAYNQLSYEFELSITPAISNLLFLIASENVYMYYLIKEESVQGFYFFRRTCAWIQGTQFISLFASYCSALCSQSEFTYGYEIALSSAVAHKDQHFRYLVLEDISDNHYIKPVSEIYRSIPMAYFFYNFAIGTIPSAKVIVVS